MLLIWYPACGTCQKAKKWLNEHDIAHATRHIRDEAPTLAELTEWHARSGLPLKRFFNTSGKRYADLNLKDRLPAMTEAEQLSLLVSDGMLVKRPLLITADQVLVGFKPAEWETVLR